MPKNLDSALIRRDLKNQILDIRDTVLKTRLLIADSGQVIQKADDLLKSDRL